MACKQQAIKGTLVEHKYRQQAQKKDLMKFIIYKHTCSISNKAYIGYTSSSSEKRMRKHLADAKRGAPYAFHAAIRKYGERCWISEILEECRSLKKAHEAEKRLIKEHQTFGKGYNMTEGGEGTLGRRVTEQAKQISRDWHLGFKHTKVARNMMKEKFTKLRGIPVNQYDVNGAYIKTFRSCVEAAEAVGNKNLAGCIHQICAKSFKRWKQAICKGYQWKFYTGDVCDISPAEDLRGRVAETLRARNKKREIPVDQYTLSGARVQTFPSAVVASNNTGIYVSGIYRCCRGQLKSAGGFVWCYG